MTPAPLPARDDEREQLVRLLDDAVNGLADAARALDMLVRRAGGLRGFPVTEALATCSTLRALAAGDFGVVEAIRRVL